MAALRAARRRLLVLFGGVIGRKGRRPAGRPPPPPDPLVRVGFCGYAGRSRPVGFLAAWGCGGPRLPHIHLEMNGYRAVSGSLLRPQISESPVASALQDRDGGFFKFTGKLHASMTRILALSASDGMTRILALSASDGDLASQVAA